MYNNFLKLAEEKITIFDGAMGTSIQNFELNEEDFNGKFGCNEYLNIVKSEIIEEIHHNFLKVGCDVIETNTFGANTLKLREYNLEDKVYEINFNGARIARKIADIYSKPRRPRFVAGSIGPTGMLPSSTDSELGNISVDDLIEIFYMQGKALIDGGVDILQIETGQDILEVKSALLGVKKISEEKNLSIPVITSVTLDSKGRMLLGTDIGAVVTTLEALDSDVIGINCGTGPEEMKDALRNLSEFCSKKIFCMPNAGMPQIFQNKTIYPFSPEDFVSFIEDFVAEYGLNIVGGCCGTTPEHIKLLVERISNFPPKKRIVKKTQYISSGIKSVSLIQDPKPLIVGERINTLGSKKIKKILLNDNYSAILPIAKLQTEQGAQILDVCVALTEKGNEKGRMEKVVKLLSSSIDIPLMIDSTEPDVIENALKIYPGRIIVNSINLEKSEEDINKILKAVKKYGSLIIAMTIDENGMAKTSYEKLNVAEKIYNTAVNKFNINPENIIFDLLTFTLATGKDEYTAIETINGIKKIKEKFPNTLSILGISNISYGLDKDTRKVLNSVFLYHSVKAGLDLAIVNPKDITPYFSIPENQRKLCDNLIFNRNKNALIELVNFFKSQKPEKISKDKITAFEKLTCEEKIKFKILNQDSENIEDLLNELLKKYKPSEIISKFLIPTMKEVGDKMSSGELILPFVLQSAEVMKECIFHLEKFFDKSKKITKGKIVLATVFGDVHDIGKNLVKTILSSNGYEVFDLGKQVPIKTIIDKAKEVDADAIGLSALLVSTSQQMHYTVQELHKRGLKYPVIVGGAAVNPTFAKKISLINENEVYPAGVFYANNAFEGLDFMNQLSQSIKRDVFIKKAVADAIKFHNSTLSKDKTTLSKKVKKIYSVQPAQIIPEPPFLGVKVINDIPLNDVFNLLDLKSLFKLSWGIRGINKKEYESLVNNKYLPLLNELKKECILKKYLLPKAVYGYFRCQSDENNLIIYSPDNINNIIAVTSFPRQKRKEKLCIADYFSSVESGILDTVAFQVVTIGPRASEITAQLYKDHDFSKSYYLHGLGVQTTEALTEYTHRLIKKELKLNENQGKRFSPGYSLWRELKDQEKIFSLLKPEENIGVSLTSGYQMVPEQSTSAIIVHHPEAKYFNV